MPALGLSNKAFFEQDGEEAAKKPDEPQAISTADLYKEASFNKIEITSKK